MKIERDRDRDGERERTSVDGYMTHLSEFNDGYDRCHGATFSLFPFSIDHRVSIADNKMIIFKEIGVLISQIDDRRVDTIVIFWR